MIDAVERICVGRSFSGPTIHPNHPATAVRMAPPQPAGDGFEDAFLASPEFMITVQRIEARQTFFDDHGGFGRFAFLFHLNGRRVVELAEADRYDLNGPTFVAYYQAEGVTRRSIWIGGDRVADVTVGFWVTQPPRILRRAIAAVPAWPAVPDAVARRSLWIQQPMSLEMEQAARLVLNPTVDPTVLEEFLVAKANELLCLGVDALLPTSPTAQNPSITLRAGLAQARRAIAESLQQPPSLSELAEIANVPAAVLSSAFRQAYGISIAEFVSQQRMQKARQLLLSTRMPLKQIAWQLGYNHATNLSLAFKRYFGITATETRRTETGKSPASLH